MPRTAATEREGAGRVAVIRAPDLVGRERELAVLAEALADGPAVVLVEGEAGIGKSRLVQEFLASPAGQRDPGLVAVCPPYRQPFTLGPVVDAIRQATEDVAGLRLSALGGALRPLFPEWASGLPGAPEPLEDAGAARHRLFRALAELVGRLSVSVLVVEDAHWADEATLEFLLFLAAQQLQSKPQRLSLLMTYRPEDVSDSSLLRRLSSRLPAGTVCERITLEPLDPAGTADLMASMLPGGHVSGEFAAFLHAHTDGLPLAVEESVRLLRDRRDLRRRGGEWVRRHLGALAVPPTIRDAVLERTGRLSGDTRAVLRAAAVLADPADEPTLSAVTGFVPGQLRAGVAGALSSGLLTEDSRGLVSFRHVLATQAIYEEVPVAERRQMHLRAGQMLESISPLPVAQLARHFREAGDTDGWCRYAEQAADLALAAGDESTAATLLHALIGDAGLPAGVVVRLVFKVPLPAVAGYAVLSDLVHSLRSVLDGGALTSAQRAEASYQLGRILIQAGEFQAGHAAIERAVPGLGHRPVDAARAMATLGWPRRTLWAARVHRRWLDQAAAALANPSVPVADRLALIVLRASALLDLGEEAGWAEVAGLPEVPATPQERQRTIVGCLNVGEAAMRWGRYDEARRRLTTALKTSRRYDYLRMRDGALVTLAHLDWFTGAWFGLAERTADLAMCNDPMISLEAVLVDGLLEVATGAHKAAIDRLYHVLNEGVRRGIADMPLEPAAALARLRLAAGCVQGALELTDDPMLIIARKGVWLWATDVAPVRVQALAAFGRDEEAAKLVAAFARGLRGCSAPAPRVALALCRAILAEGRGEHIRAAALFGRAADDWAALPRPYDALLARERQGCCLLTAGKRDEGLALLTEVLSGLSGLGASGDAERVVRALREHGGPVRQPWRGGQRGYGNRLSPREIEVVRLMAAGQTNRQIAQSLCRSPHTVNSQLRSAMRKLGVSSRAALAVNAIASGVAGDAQAQSGTGSSAAR